MEWRNVDLEAEEDKTIAKPKHRESPAIFYEKDSSKLIIYGGWSN